MADDNHEEREKEKTIEELIEEAREVLRKAEPSIRMSMALQFKDYKETCLAPAYILRD